MPATPKPTSSDQSARFRRTRDVHTRETAEDDVEAIAELLDEP